ncbi:hypothetical protein F2P81_004238 [Scophthalmus maximus]|uniref:Uncharacterized protein n=1 Tax=Scophthalmus maximus TaxID=52904 RepID=A0A6A4TJ63_SCOMX|nr:hypothetical protein F2P81_004238 [Scophthalmus maximus]
MMTSNLAFVFTDYLKKTRTQHDDKPASCITQQMDWSKIWIQIVTDWHELKTLTEWITTTRPTCVNHCCCQSGNTAEAQQIGGSCRKQRKDLMPDQGAAVVLFTDLIRSSGFHTPASGPGFGRELDGAGGKKGLQTKRHQTTERKKKQAKVLVDDEDQPVNIRRSLEFDNDSPLVKRGSDDSTSRTLKWQQRHSSAFSGPVFTLQQIAQLSRPVSSQWTVFGSYAFAQSHPNIRIVLGEDDFGSWQKRPPPSGGSVTEIKSRVLY